VPYRVNQVPNSTRWQIFLRDPNNVEIELNFETTNETPPEFPVFLLLDIKACDAVLTCTTSRSLAKLFAEFNAQLLHKP
jgi:hypothetical protein